MSANQAFLNDNKLDFPRNYFDVSSGTSPTDIMEIQKRWEYRKNRCKSNIDDEEFDCIKMRKEIEDYRTSLRLHIAKAFFETARSIANVEGLKLQDTNQTAILPKDIVKALCQLENTQSNNVLVYKSFFEFHKKRSWLSAQIDEWLANNNMRLKPTEKNSQKFYTDDRGGFTAVARYSKSQIISRFMTPLYIKRRWCIASKRPSKSTQTSKHYREVYKDDNLQYNTTDGREPKKILLYYVVTPTDYANAFAKKKSKIALTLDNYFNIDYETIMNQIFDNQALTTKEDLKMIIQNNSVPKQKMKDLINHHEDDVDEGNENIDGDTDGMGTDVVPIEYEQQANDLVDLLTLSYQRGENVEYNRSLEENQMTDQRVENVEDNSLLYASMMTDFQVSTAMPPPTEETVTKMTTTQEPLSSEVSTVVPPPTEETVTKMKTTQEPSLSSEEKEMANNQGDIINDQVSTVLPQSPEASVTKMTTTQEPLSKGESDAKANQDKEVEQISNGNKEIRKVRLIYNKCIYLLLLANHYQTYN